VATPTRMKLDNQKGYNCGGYKCFGVDGMSDGIHCRKWCYDSKFNTNSSQRAIQHGNHI